VNPVHNAPRLSVMGPGVQADRAQRGGWGRERFVTDRLGPIFHPLLHRPLPFPTPQNLRHRHRDHPDGCCGPPAGPVGGCLPWPPWPPCPALPCPYPALFVTTDRQTPLLLLYIGYTCLIAGYWVGPSKSL
jgi:hypothetical protein